MIVQGMKKCKSLLITSKKILHLILRIRELWINNTLKHHFLNLALVKVK